MAYTLSNLLQDVLGSQLGRARSFLATSGTATTAVDTRLGNLVEPPVTDYAVGYSLFVVSASGATPEGQFANITGYNSGTYTYTFDTVTDAVDADDEIMIADDLFPLRDMIRIANRVIQKFEIELEDSSLTTAAQQTEYDLPVAYKQDRPLSVWYQGQTGDSNDNQRIPVNPVELVPTAAGSVGKLILPQLPSGRTLYVRGITAHPALTIYSSTLREEIHPDLAVAAVTRAALVEFNARNEGRSEFWINKLADATVHYNDMLAAHPIYHTRRTYNTIPAWGGSSGDGVPSPILT